MPKWMEFQANYQFTIAKFVGHVSWFFCNSYLNVSAYPHYVNGTT